MDKPLVTVLLSSYNRPRLIRDALDSILAQTWPNIQVIVADDWSTSKVWAKFMNYRKQHEWLDVIRPEKEPTIDDRQYGQRCSVCINAAMQYARGEFVAFLPDDDFLTPRSIEIRAQYLVDYPDVNAVYGRLEACKSYEPIAGIHYFPLAGTVDQIGPVSTQCRHDRNGFWSAEPIVRAANRIDHSMMMVRRVPNIIEGSLFNMSKMRQTELPEWPEVKTQEWFHVCSHATRAFMVSSQEKELGKPPWEYKPWASSSGGLRTAFCYTDGEQFDCPDAGFFFRLELAGLGPFHSVDEVVTVKRYHSMHHRTDPSRRE